MYPVEPRAYLNIGSGGGVGGCSVGRGPRGGGGRGPRVGGGQGDGAQMAVILFHLKCHLKIEVTVL